MIKPRWDDLPSINGKTQRWLLRRSKQSVANVYPGMDKIQESSLLRHGCALNTRLAHLRLLHDVRFLGGGFLTVSRQRVQEYPNRRITGYHSLGCQGRQLSWIGWRFLQVLQRLRCSPSLENVKRGFSARYLG